MFPRANVFSHKDGQSEHLFQFILPHNVSQQRSIEAHLNVTNFIGPPMNVPHLIPKYQWSPVEQPDVSSSPIGVKGSNRKRRRDNHSQNDLKRQCYSSPCPHNQPSRNANFTSQPATAPVTSRQTSRSSSSITTCSSAASKPGGCVPSLREGSHQSTSPPSSVNDKPATAPVTSRETSRSSSSITTCSSAASKPGGCVPSLREGSHQSAFPPSSVNDKISQQILDLFHACEQQNVDLEKKELCRAALQRDIQTIFPCAQVFLAGSSLNGFGSRSSDADLCLVIERGMEIHKKAAICVLSHVQKLFKTLSYIERPILIRAKVPILKFRDRVSGVEFDLNVNNTVGIRNTFLLRTYAYVEKRVRPIILVIKEWANHQGINNASQGTLSSYTLVLMVLHYLQTLPEPVIPCLQMDYPECFNPKMDIHLAPSRPSNIPAFVSKNQSSLGDLLLGFLKYYATAFKWDKHVISVREAKTLPRTREWENMLLCVEEPFNRTNTARAVHNKNHFEVIKAKFTKSYRVLQERKDLNFILPLKYTRSQTYQSVRILKRSGKTF